MYTRTKTPPSRTAGRLNHTFPKGGDRHFCQEIFRRRVENDAFKYIVNLATRTSINAISRRKTFELHSSESPTSLSVYHSHHPLDNPLTTLPIYFLHTITHNNVYKTLKISSVKTIRPAYPDLSGIG